jgi:hypothetical protein
VRRERDGLEASAEAFRSLVELGLLEPERRLDLVELVHALRSRHRLLGLEYEIGPQRPLPLARGTRLDALEVLASRVKLKARGLHEAEVLAFIEALSQSPPGFRPVEQCLIRRLRATGDARSPRIEADCTLEWITLKEKRGAPAA